MTASLNSWELVDIEVEYLIHKFDSKIHGILDIKNYRH